MMMLFSIEVASAQNHSPVEGKIYEGNLNGMATLKFDFKSNGEAVFTMTLFGNKESKTVTYEQTGASITVHAQNGDMILTQNDAGNLSTNVKGNVVLLECQTPVSAENQIDNVIGHTFSGNFGDNGKLTLSFTEQGVVNVSVITNQQNQSETWPYQQEGNKVTMTEPMGRHITLTLSSNNQLKGMFTIINVSLSLVQ